MTCEILFSVWWKCCELQNWQDSYLVPVYMGKSAPIMGINLLSVVEKVNERV